MKHLPCAVATTVACFVSLMGLAQGPSALVNPGFEEVRWGWNADLMSPGSWVGGGRIHGGLTGWAHYGPVSGSTSGLGYRFAVNGFNPAGWAEAYLVDNTWTPALYQDVTESWRDFLVVDNTWHWNSPTSADRSLDGRYSIALMSFYPADALITDPQWGFSGWSDIGTRSGDSLYLGRAGIAQTVTLPPDIEEFTCYYTQPNITDFPTGGSVVLSFNNQVLGYTLEPTLGPKGPTTLLRADLTPLAGQSGELRIGIEGPGYFLIDSITVIPEASATAGGSLLALGVMLLAARRHRARSRDAPSLDRIKATV